jgi:hypothetical protein
MSERDEADRDERAEKLEEIARRYEAGESADALADEYGISRRTIFSYLQKAGITKLTRSKLAERKVRETEIKALNDEAEKITTVAFGLGGVIARRYLPLIDHLMGEGKTLEYIATEIMDWFEMKHATENRIKELEAKIDHLNREVGEAYAIAAPNFKYLLRSLLLKKYADRLLLARMSGLKVPVGPTLTALHNDLLDLEKDIEGAKEVERPD